MILGVNAYEMEGRDKIRRASVIMTGIAVKNMDNGKTYNIFLTKGFAITPLPAGTYCISYFRTYINVTLPYCKDPYFSVVKGLAMNLGYVLLGVNYRDPSGVRYKPFSLYNDTQQLAFDLTPAARREVGDFLGNPSPSLTTLAGSTWYGYEFGGLDFVMKLVPGGTVEYRADPASTYGSPVAGTWTSDNSGVIITLKNGQLIYRGTLNQGLLSGTVEDISPESSSDSNNGAHWIWHATTNPMVTLPYNASSQAKIVYLDGIYYPKEALDKGITGLVRIHYQLPLPSAGMFGIQPTVNPINMHVIDSQPEGVFDATAQEAFASAFFSNGVVDGKPIESEGDEIITFQIVDGKPVISYSSKLEPVMPSTDPDGAH